MINKKFNHLTIFLFENLLKYDKISHFITTRNNGISPKPFKSLNLGFNSGDSIENVEKNWHILMENIGLNETKIFTLNQIHSDKIVIANSKIIENSGQKIEGDAIITDLKGLFIAVLVADCVPIILYDPIKSIISVVHAGWKGSSLEIAKKTVEKMEKVFLSKPKDIIAGIGPSIGPCCYKVKNDVQKYFSNYRNAVIVKNNEYYINLWEVNKSQLIKSGINENNIEVSRLCTSCNNKIFYSYRKENPIGRFVAGIVMK